MSEQKVLNKKADFENFTDSLELRVFEKKFDSEKFFVLIIY